MPDSINIVLQRYVEEIKKIYGVHVKQVILYGSYARGDYNKDSDIDIMILLDVSVMERLLRIIPMISRIQVV